MPESELPLMVGPWSRTDLSEPAPLASGGTTDIGQILSLAVNKNVPVETLERLVALYERMADRRAAQDFAQALADFQAECPSIPKSSTAKFTTANGGVTAYNYAELDEIAATIGPKLHARGMSYSWDSVEDAGRLTCVCTLRHANGHSVSASFSCPTESRAGMNMQQKSAAALTYARRQSLVQVLGLTMTDVDPDGADPATLEPINETQAADLSLLLAEVNAPLDKFLAWLEVDAIAKIPSRDYLRAVRALEARRAK